MSTDPVFRAIDNWSTLCFRRQWYIISDDVREALSDAHLSGNPDTKPVLVNIEIATGKNGKGTGKVEEIAVDLLYDVLANNARKHY